MATVGAYGPPNLKHLLLDNGAHDSTGGQATVSPSISFAGVAAACGYSRAIEGDDLGDLAAWLEEPWRSGPSFARLWIRSGHAGRFAAAVDLARRREDSLHAAFCRRCTLMLLLNPGPVTLTERVRRSLLQPDLCHRESEFFDLQDEARQRLLEVYWARRGGMDRHLDHRLGHQLPSNP